MPRGQLPAAGADVRIAGRMAIQVGADLAASAGGACWCWARATRAGAAAARRSARRAGHAALPRERRATRCAPRWRPRAVAIATPEAIEPPRSPPTSSWARCSFPRQPTPKLLPRSLVRAHEARRGDRRHLDRRGRRRRDLAPHDARRAHVRRGRRGPLLRGQHARRRSARAPPTRSPRRCCPTSLEMAAKGVARAVRENAALRAGVLLWEGRDHAGIAPKRACPTARSPTRPHDADGPRPAHRRAPAADAVHASAATTGCRPYADAIASGVADINQCPPGGDEGVAQLARAARPRGEAAQSRERRSTARRRSRSSTRRSASAAPSASRPARWTRSSAPRSSCTR